MFSLSPLHKAYRYAIAFVVLVITLSVASTSIPPMQSPDEGAHHVRAYGIAQGIFMLENVPGKNTSLHIDSNLTLFLSGFLPNRSANLWGPNAETLAKLKQLRWTGNLEFLDSNSTGYKNPLIYLPQAIGIRLGQELDLTIYETYYVARFFSLTTSLALIFFALTLFLPSPLVIGLLVLPMSIFQIMMPTADGISYGLTLLILCLFSRLHAKQVHSVGASLLLAIAICFLVSSRIYTFPIFLLLLFLPNTYRPALKLTLFTVSAVVCISWLTLSISNSIDLRVSRPLTSMQIAIYYLSHPYEWAKIFFNTISSPTQLEFYGKGFIGVLGWLHVSLPQWYYYLSPAILLSLLATELVNATQFRRYVLFDKNALLYLSVTLLMCFVVLNGMLVGWTPFPSTVIEGVQGRYFWIPACCLAFCLNARQAYSKLNIAILVLFFVLNVYIIVDSFTSFYP